MFYQYFKFKDYSLYVKYTFYHALNYVIIIQKISSSFYWSVTLYESLILL